MSPVRTHCFDGRGTRRAQHLRHLRLDLAKHPFAVTCVRTIEAVDRNPAQRDPMVGSVSQERAKCETTCPAAEHSSDTFAPVCRDADDSDDPCPRRSVTVEQPLPQQRRLRGLPRWIHEHHSVNDFIKISGCAERSSLRSLPARNTWPTVWSRRHATLSGSLPGSYSTYRRSGLQRPSGTFVTSNTTPSGVTGRSTRTPIQPLVKIVVEAQSAHPSRARSRRT